MGLTPSLVLMDQYLPGLNAVATGQMNPQAAIEWVESAARCLGKFATNIG